VRRLQSNLSTDVEEALGQLEALRTYHGEGGVSFHL